MNGSQLGFITDAGEGKFGYEEITSFPLNEEEINKLLQIVTDFLKDSVSNFVGVLLSQKLGAWRNYLDTSERKDT
jgi:hypothetical protein